MRIRLGRLVSPVMVHRDRERAALGDALVGAPTVVCVAGEAGVGKSRLLREVVGAFVDGPAAGLAVLVGHCHPIGEAFPFGPVVEALSDGAAVLARRPPPGPLAGVLRSLVPELAGWLPAAPAASGDPRIDRHRQFRAVREVLGTVGPAVLLIEDLHWADQGTMELIGYLTRQPPPDLRIVLTYRPEDLRAQYAPSAFGSQLLTGVSYVELELAPLTVAGVRAQTAAILGTEVSRAVAAYMHQRTAGLPFAVEELLRLLHDRGESPADRADYGAEPVVPPVLRDSVRERLGRLGGSARRIVYAAAVLHVPSPQQDLVGTAGLGERTGAAALSEALASALLWPGPAGTYWFRHALALEAAHAAVPRPQLRGLHAAAARVLRRLDPVPHARLARHCRAAGQLRDWRRYAEAAADRAAQHGDYPAAIDFLIELLSASAVPSATRMRLAVKLGRAAGTGVTGDHNVVSVLRKVLTDEHLPAPVRGELRVLMGMQILNGHSDKREGRAEVQRAVADLRSRPHIAARALSVMAYPNQTEEHVAVHLRDLDRATELLSRIDDPTQRLVVEINRAMVLLNLGDPGAWSAIEALSAQDEVPAQRVQLLRGMVNFASAAALLGHIDHARRFLARAAELRQESDGGFVDGMVGATTIRLSWLTGRWSDLHTQVRRQHREWTSMAVEAQLVSGLLALARGNLVAADRDLREVLGMTGPALCGPEPAMAGSALARLLMSRDETASAEAEIDRLVDLARRKGAWAWSSPLVPAAVAVYLRAGRIVDADALVDEMGAGVAGLDAPLAHARHRDARARLSVGCGRHGEATTEFCAVADTYRSLMLPYLAAQALEAAGLCRYADGADGATELRAALAEFERLGASWDAGRCRGLLRQRGVVVTHRRGRRGYGTALSPREREVAALVAVGNTNRQIAAALCLSERTVEEHVGKVLRKLDIRSRRELATRMAPTA